MEASLIYIFLLTTCLLNFIRPDFLDLGIAISGFYYLKTRTYDTRKYRGIAVAALLGNLLDLLWLYIYFKPWGSGYGPEGTVHLMAVFLTLVNFIGKFVIAFLFWRNTIRSS
ncbi:MAG: hypothetical protein V2I33_20560 [Kangiellaceae bacterium]|nr:hypothetical protein [Kangiellaceae bacterium]